MSIPRVLTIAGSDSGGGAGIQADLKTFQELGVYGMSVITAVTAQNTVVVSDVFPLPPETVRRQLTAIGEDLGPHAVKTGMLYSSEIIEAVVQSVKRWEWRNLVVDPVMLSKSGASLLQDEAVDDLVHRLLPLARLITPNLPEARLLTGVDIVDEDSMRLAAERISRFGVGGVLIKGGHFHEEGETSQDYLFTGTEEFWFSGPRYKTRHTHGTGCTLSSAVASGLAQGLSVQEAVALGKSFIEAAISQPISMGAGHGPVNHWAYRSRLDTGRMR
ncbi:bifunctional hydroxymethylpyrimidine kinase/phosphomethylpyrimidine kinase [Paenibacillus tuaregi]|uniref:bifunctional hydroxymethylpyrimidine kinase/phosphomethylpyrimidine kinase n=1 Tax=Paenibacillus tuaregi TaxID=1816681 RepID=UPI000838E6FD|nr:bifunctional hydroxymethylpyrimidine kinase/phosphomethylpyrimidine kinase [Paenibacillus tuaregi]